MEFEEAADEVKVLVKGHVVKVDVADERKLRLRAATAGFTVEGPQVVAVGGGARARSVVVERKPARRLINRQA